MNRIEILSALRAEVQGAVAADLPCIIGQIEAVKAEAFARLVAQSEQSKISESVDDDRDDAS
jgi:hypothetical protein